MGDSGEYGTQTYYFKEERIDLNETHYRIRSFYYYNKSKDLADITDETYSDNSFCYQTTLIKNGINFNSTVARAVCYESFCSNLSLTIKINDDFFVCPRAGGKIEVEGYTGYFLCADYNLICSVTVMCNDLFDCIDKKSETKEESYYYDYNILTSQNLEDAEIKEAEYINNYELSENGICPKDCKQCQENKRYLKCRNDYYFVGSNKNTEEITCLPLSQLSQGYYQLNNIYYKCIDNCDSCNDGETCQQCTNGFTYSNNKCIKLIENCENYGKDDNCEKCKNNFAFKEENKTVCLSTINFDNHYTKDGGISYYPCEKEIHNCSKCYYNNEKSTTNCYLCITNYFLFENENKEICLSEQYLNNTLYKKNETQIDKCSNAINNCKECNNENNCTRCDSYFYMINDNIKNCIDVSFIPTDELYLNEGKNMYYSCNDSNYNDIANSKSCSGKNNCSLCQNKFNFINCNKSVCVEIETLNNKYVKDPND